MRQEDKDWIDNASYEQLLHKWRFAPVEDSMFTFETGKYYAQVMGEKKKQISNSEHVKASKSIGW